MRRYTLTDRAGGGALVPDVKGNWANYYEAQAEIKRLREECDIVLRTNRVVEGHVTSMEVENERLRELIAKLRVRFIGVKTPHPAQHEWRELWDEMVAAEAGGK